MTDDTTPRRRLDSRGSGLAIGVTFLMVGLGLWLAADGGPSGVAFVVLGLVFIAMACSRPSGRSRRR